MNTQQLRWAAVPRWTLTAATRARQLAHGATPLVEESGKHKPTVTALREIAAGQIGVELLDRQK